MKFLVGVLIAFGALMAAFWFFLHHRALGRAAGEMQGGFVGGAEHGSGGSTSAALLMGGGAINYGRPSAGGQWATGPGTAGPLVGLTPEEEHMVMTSDPDAYNQAIQDEAFAEGGTP